MKKDSFQTLQSDLYRTFCCFVQKYSVSSKAFCTYSCLSITADAALLTPCSSSFSSVSRTLGEFEAKRRQCRFSSGMMNSSNLLGDKPLGVVWRAAEGTDSSRMEPRSVFIWGHHSMSVHPAKSIEAHTHWAPRRERFEFTSVVRKTILQLYWAPLDPSFSSRRKLMATGPRRSSMPKKFWCSVRKIQCGG